VLKKVTAVFLIVFILFNVSNISFADEPSISAESAILIDANTGQILFEKNANKSMYPASTTKIMTGILALELGNLEDKVVIDNETPYGIDGSHIALEPGEILSLQDLIYALLIESANDAAVAIAKHISGSVEEFAKLMNKKAKEVGALNTHFTNPNGLPDKEHTSTAYDLAMMAKYAMQNEKFKDIVKRYNYTIEPTNKKSEPRYLKSSNRMLYGTGSNNMINVDGKWVDIKYEGADGIKTGYTYEAQNCLVATAVRGNQRLISVVLHAVGRNVYVDTHKLLNYGFENYTYKQIGFTNEFIDNIKVEHGDKDLIPAILGESVYITLPKGREGDIEKIVELPDKVTAPISKNQVLGKMTYKIDDTTLATANIISTIDVNQKAIYKVVNKGFTFTLYKKWWFWILMLFFIWRIYIAYRKHKRRKRRSRRISYYYTKPR
jgi:D-alanyl-D-alanine carboxypeptidase (penicillin-binding protein 5/6)